MANIGGDPTWPSGVSANIGGDPDWRDVKTVTDTAADTGDAPAVEPH